MSQTQTLCEEEWCQEMQQTIEKAELLMVIEYLNLNLQEHETIPDGMAPGLYAGERPATGGTAGRRVPGPQPGGEILPPRGSSDVTEAGSHGLPTVYGVHEVHPDARDGGGAERAARETSPSHGGARVPGDGRRAETARIYGARNYRARTDESRAPHGGRVTSDHLDASERQLLSKVILGTGSTSCTADDVSRVLNMCRHVMETEQCQTLEHITVCENDNFEEMIDALLLNCI